MIVLFLLQIIYAVIFALTFYLPDSNILPWGIDSVMVSLFGMVNSLKQEIWPIVFPLSLFLYYVLFLIGMRVMKLFLGSRTPVN